MPFSQEMAAPDRLETEDFLLRPITAADAERDYAAVMESREYLRLWEQSTWPADEFTVAENRMDLEKLERWNAERAAFTYTVLDPTETVCLGCVYIFPTNRSAFDKAEITAVDGGRLDEHEAAVYFWVRKSRLATRMDEVLLKALRKWLDSDWDLGGHVFVTNEQFAQQAQMLETSGLRRRFVIKEEAKPGAYLAYAET